MLDLRESELTLLETLSGARFSEDGLDHHHHSRHSDPLHREDGDRRDTIDDMAEHEDTEAAKFCTAWLLCVGSGTVGCLLAKVGANMTG